MKYLVVFALVAAAAAVPVAEERDKRSYYQYPSPQYISGNDQYYVNQAQPVYSSSLVYSSAPVYNDQLVQPSYGVPITQTGSVYPSYTSPTYVQRPQYTGVYNTPFNTQVSSQALYNSEQSSHASTSSVYRVQSPATVTYAVQSPSAQYIAPTWNKGNWVVANNPGSNWNINDPWC